MRVVHLSVLNPCEHTRIYSKEALTAAQAGYTVYIVAAGVGTPYRKNGVALLPTGLQSRRPAARLCAQLHMLRCCLRLRPQLLHIHTPELLPLALLLRWLLACRVVYDRHEDYPLNIRCGTHYPTPVRSLLALAVWVLEHISIAWVHHLLLAEACYTGQLPHPATLVANRALPPQHTGTVRPPTPPIRLLYTGTLAPHWGVERALALYSQLGPGYTLTIAGHTHSAPYALWLGQQCQALGATLVGGTGYVPHHELLALMQSHHLGLALYTPTPAIAPRIPTKFYEYMAAGLPFLFTDHEPWNALGQATDMGLPLSRWAEAPALLARYRQPHPQHWQWAPAPLLQAYRAVFLQEN